MAEKLDSKKIMTGFAMVILLTLAGNGYLFYQLNKLSTNLEAAKEQSASELTIMENMVASVQEEYKSKIESLTKALEKIEKESNIKISELEEEVKNVNIQSGDFSAILDEVFQGVVSIVTDIGQGSGAFISSDGFIITNEHVIRGAKAIRVVDYEGNIYAAKVNGTNRGVDIAVLKITPQKKVNRLTFTSSSSLKVGEKVVAVGNPAGLGFTATEGIISQLGRFADRNNPEGLMQIDVPINPGNSGGAIVNINGNIVGIAKSKIAGLESLGFAIPADAAKLAAEEIMNADF